MAVGGRSGDRVVGPGEQSKCPGKKRDPSPNRDWECWGEENPFLLRQKGYEVDLGQ